MSAEADAAWEALKLDIIKSCPDDFPIAILAVTAHRPLIEAAIRSAGPPPASRESWQGGMPLIPAWCIDHAEMEVFWQGHHIPVQASPPTGAQK